MILQPKLPQGFTVGCLHTKIMFHSYVNPTQPKISLIKRIYVMTRFASVAAEVRHEPESAPTSFYLALVWTFTCVQPQVLSPSPSPFECHTTSFPCALQRPLIIMNSLMKHKIFVGTEPLPAFFIMALVTLVQQ
uniref:Uncharacterized protein n=1 Tax=Opuntia streptacantha TaxID=393608 RepID=A0A7C8Z6Z0_OPUST